MRALTRIALILALVAGVAFVATTTTSCNKETKPADSGPPSQLTVEVYGNEFKPSTATIAKGGTITFKNRDKIEYNLNCDGLFQEVLPAGQSWDYTFQNTGEFRVYDDINAIPSEMKVIVQ